LKDIILTFTSQAIPLQWSNRSHTFSTSVHAWYCWSDHVMLAELWTKTIV